MSYKTEYQLVHETMRDEFEKKCSELGTKGWVWCGTHTHLYDPPEDRHHYTMLFSKTTPVIPEEGKIVLTAELAICLLRVFEDEEDLLLGHAEHALLRSKGLITGEKYEPKITSNGRIVVRKMLGE